MLLKLVYIIPFLYSIASFTQKELTLFQQWKDTKTLQNHSKNMIQEVENVKNYVISHTKKDDYIFTLQSPAYYFFCQRRNPTRFPSLNHMTTEHHREEALNDLRYNQPLYIINKRNK